MTAPAERQPALKDVILEQATRLFAVRGYAGTSIREVVAACHCTKPALYYYFPSKDALYREVVHHAIQAIESAVQTTTDHDGPLRSRLHGFVDDSIKFCHDNPHSARLLFRLDNLREDGAPNLDLEALRERYLGRLAVLVQQGIQRGELDANLAPQDGALLLIGCLQFQVEAAVSTGTWDPTCIHRTIDLLLDGISS